MSSIQTVLLVYVYSIATGFDKLEVNLTNNVVKMKHFYDHAIIKPDSNCINYLYFGLSLEYIMLSKVIF